MYNYYDSDEDDVRCPYCGSIHITPYQETKVEKKGYGIGKGVVGAILLGPIGLTAGFIGSSKIKNIETDIKCKCLHCGHTWDV